MTRIDSPATRAFADLCSLARRSQQLHAGNAVLTALAWLAAARMVLVEARTQIDSIDRLTESAAWKVLLDYGFPYEALSLVGAERDQVDAVEVAQRAHAAAIVSDLYKQVGTSTWDVLPALFELAHRREVDGGFILLPELVDLLLDLIGEPEEEIWIPFDGTGQLTVSALRRGWNVLAESPLGWTSLMWRLLLTIECGEAWHAQVRPHAEAGSMGVESRRSTHVLVAPPFGVLVRESKLGRWGSQDSETFARSETWAVHEFVNRARRRGVFLVPQGVLFARGQELRLREHLLHRGGEANELEAVIALPPGVFSGTSIAGAIIVSNLTQHVDVTRMVDLGSGRRSLQDATEILCEAREAALGASPISDRVQLVSRQEIASNEVSFAPSRYLRKVTEIGPRAIRLDDLCTVIRPPVPSREPASVRAAELGLPELGQWAPVSHVPEKTVALKGRPRDEASIRAGDLVICIKGSIGRLGIVGQVAGDAQIVPSQSCIGLRLRTSSSSTMVSPEYLLMYLRSEQGQAQLEGLKVGAGVQHISPNTLLSSVLIPVPTAEELGEVIQDYGQLCVMEAEVSKLRAAMTELGSSRWSASN